MFDATDISRVYQIAARRVFNQTDREDIAQSACLDMIQRGSPAFRAVIDCARRFYASRNPGSMRARTVPGGDLADLCSHYPTQAQLWDRWLDEETEDQTEEWRRLPAAERDSRIVESLTALGCSL